MTEQSATNTCVACGHAMPLDDQICATCGAEQKPQLCVRCHRPVPQNAECCAKCGKYQRGLWNWILKYLPIFSFLLTLATAVVVPLVWAIMHRNSHTDFDVVGADPNHIILKVENTGLRSSTLMAYRLRAEKNLDKEFMLILGATPNVIAPRSTQQQAFLTDPAEVPADREAQQYTVAERAQLLAEPWANVPLRLEIQVKESNGQILWLRKHFKAGLIAQFIPKVRP